MSITSLPEPSPPQIDELSTQHRCKWMAGNPGKYSSKMVREFHASYAVTVENNMPPRAKPLVQPPADYIVMGCPC
ncbi:hypothetical protein H5410_003698 [Solanum commersonii]|uniref:Uncharacterized protein n=1 Tax=Solanum commersonii TaxID=4109 RepID=A0A9J6B5D2_SOLCO|nr:hypothetical protein H5410_003698 [Solanum commersonii]